VALYESTYDTTRAVVGFDLHRADAGAPGFIGSGRDDSRGQEVAYLRGNCGGALPLLRRELSRRMTGRFRSELRVSRRGWVVGATKRVGRAAAARRRAGGPVCRTCGRARLNLLDAVGYVTQIKQDLTPGIRLLAAISEQVPGGAASMNLGF